MHAKPVLIYFIDYSFFLKKSELKMYFQCIEIHVYLLAKELRF